MTISKALFTQLFITANSAKNLTLPQWEEVIIIARDAKVLGKLAYFLQQAGVYSDLPEYAKRHLANASAIAAKQNKQIHYEAEELRKIVSHCTTSAVFLKGAAYSLKGCKAGMGRIYSDLDLIVDKSAIDALESRLSIMGWLAKETDEYDQHYYREWAHEIPPMSHAIRGTVLDLHHNLVPPMSGRAERLECIISSTSKLDDGIAVLSPEAMTLHSAIHLFFNEEFSNGYRDIHDLHMLISEYASDEYWQTLKEMARESEFLVELFLACRYCEQMFNTAIPKSLFEPSLLSRLQKRLWFWDQIFSKVLYPHHKLLTVNNQNSAILLALTRGHILKMPLPMLLQHCVIKGYRGLMKLIFGKSFFMKDKKESSL